MKFTEKQIDAYVEYFTILAGIQRRLDMEKRQKKQENDTDTKEPMSPRNEE